MKGKTWIVGRDHVPWKTHAKKSEHHVISKRELSRHEEENWFGGNTKNKISEAVLNRGNLYK